MSVPKRHHFVPQMILNGFTDEAGWLHWCFTRKGRAVPHKARVDELFLRKHLYSTISAAGDKDPATELALSRVEAEAAGVVAELIDSARSSRLPDLSPRQKQAWYRFFLAQWRRTPENQSAVISDEQAMAMLQETIERARIRFPAREAELAELATPAEKARILRNVRIDTLREPSSNLISVLERRGIAILHIRRRDKRFIIGSRPVVKLTVAGRTDLNDPTVEMWLPIASDIAVGAGQGGGESACIFSTIRRRSAN